MGKGNGEGWGDGEEGSGYGMKNEWKTGLCSSCKFGPKCFIGCCCPPIGNYFIAEKTNASDIEKYIGCIDWTGCTGFLGSAIGLFMMRQKIRQNDGMDKGEIGDMVRLYCCLPCTICQTAIHVGIDD